MADWQKILDDCSRLANDAGATPAEREAALRKMTSIMDKYKLEVSKELKVSSVNHKDVVLEGTYKTRQIEIAAILSKLFDVKIIGSRGYRRREYSSMTVIGTEFGIESLLAIWAVVVSQFRYGMDTATVFGRSGYASYATGFIMGLNANAARVWAERNKNVDVMALVLSSDKQNEEYSREMFGRLGERQINANPSDMKAARKGYLDGSSATIDRTLKDE